MTPHDVDKLARRYYVRMASLALVALALGGLQHIVAADPNHMAAPTVAGAVLLVLGLRRS